mgnify:CR=1 FL=1
MASYSAKSSREKGVGNIEAFLFLPVAVLHLAAVAWRIVADKLVVDSQIGGCFHKQGRALLSVGEEAVGELCAVARLDALHADSAACIPLEQLFQKVGGGVNALLWVSDQESQAGELVNGGVFRSRIHKRLISE